MKIKAKSITAVLMAAAMSVCATTAAFAASTTDTPVVDENHTSADFQQKITYSKSESEIVPSYTVSIPLTAELQKESSTLSYSLALENDTAFVPSGKKVSVTIAGTSYFRNQMVLTGEVESAAKPTLRYQFIMPYESIVETTGAKDEVNGVELASFTEDGSTTFTVKPVLNNPSTPKGVKYTGTMTYAVSLTDAK